MQNWNITGTDYKEYDHGTTNGQGFIALKPEVVQPSGFGALVQTLRYEPFKGKRICMSADVKTENAEGWVGLWLRFDRDPGKEIIVIDNMHDRPISGTNDWQSYEIVLDVSEETQLALYGLILHGKGRAEIRNLVFREVGTDVPLTAEPVAV